jgi:hypothetical protein
VTARTDLSWPLVAANLIAAALVLWPWLPRTAPAGPAPVAAIDNDLPKLPSLAPFADFDAIIARPLFAPSRRPTPVVKPAMAAIESRYRLQGVITVAGTPHALVAPVAGGSALDLGVGDALESWSVKTIASDRVTLSSPAGEATLTFGHAGAGPAKP